MRFTNSLILASGLLAAGTAFGGDLLQWQSNSLTYLYGKDFTVNPDIQQTFTFEHADAWKYGDNFLFVDKIFYNGKKDGNNGPNTYYGEFSRACRSARSSTRTCRSARSRMCCWP